MEAQLENKYLNDSYNYSIWDGVLWSMIKAEPNLDCFMNTTMHEVISDGSHIEAVKCYQMTTETEYRIEGGIFIDATGNGTLGYFAGAEYRIGREEKGEFNEKDAPEKPDGETMGNTIYFVARDMGHPVRFIKPDWAYTFDESFFKHRYHGDIVVYHDADDVVVLKPDEDYEDHRDQLVEKYDVQSGYWWIELGGDWDDIIKSSEEIRWELYKTIYGVWDHIKNGGDHGAENYDLVWVGNLAGMRESRRLVGDYILTENDISSNKEFEDGVAYGGWPMDDHCPGGFRTPEVEPTIFHPAPSPFGIPYRCVYSVNIENLFFAGRNISVTHTAMSSSRVMATCALLGQAVGTAAALAVRHRCSPRAVGQKYIEELQQLLMRDDCFLPGLRYTPSALTRDAALSADCGDPSGLRGGLNRAIDGVDESWPAAPGATAEYRWETPRRLSGCRLVFDSDLNRPEKNIVAVRFLNTPRVALPKTLVRRFRLEYEDAAGNRRELGTFDNEQRLRKIAFDVTAVALRLTILETGSGRAERVFAWDVC